MSENLKCPFCGSRNTEMSFDTKIKMGLGHIAEFGIGFAAGYYGLGGLVEDSDINIADNVSRVWECNSCGKTWVPDEKEREERFMREFKNEIKRIKEERGPNIGYFVPESESIVQLSVEEKEYLEAYKDVAVDNIVSDKERRILDRLRNMLCISEERAQELERLK